MVLKNIKETDRFKKEALTGLICDNSTLYHFKLKKSGTVKYFV